MGDIISMTALGIAVMALLQWLSIVLFSEEWSGKTLGRSVVDQQKNGVNK
jgi:hypothetical protein